MKIQYNTDKTISGEQRNQEYYASVIREELDRFREHITRIEVHLSDENGKKEGFRDMRCVMEARLEGRQPLAVKSQADSVELAMTGAIQKLRASLETIIGKNLNH